MEVPAMPMLGFAYKVSLLHILYDQQTGPQANLPQAIFARLFQHMAPNIRQRLALASRTDGHT